MNLSHLAMFNLKIMNFKVRQKNYPGDVVVTRGAGVIDIYDLTVMTKDGADVSHPTYKFHTKRKGRVRSNTVGLVVGSWGSLSCVLFSTDNILGWLYDGSLRLLIENSYFDDWNPTQADT